MVIGEVESCPDRTDALSVGDDILEKLESWTSREWIYKELKRAVERAIER